MNGSNLGCYINSYLSSVKLSSAINSQGSHFKSWNELETKQKIQTKWICENPCDISQTKKCKKNPLVMENREEAGVDFSLSKLGRIRNDMKTILASSSTPALLEWMEACRKQETMWASTTWDKGCLEMKLNFFQQETLKVRGLCKGLWDVGGGGIDGRSTRLVGRDSKQD